MSAPSPLYRTEITKVRQKRVEGEILLTQPVGTQTLCLLLFALIASIVAWFTLGHYSRTEVARGILTTEVASAKIVALRPGQVTALNVRDGDIVQAGQLLATIRTEQADERGASTIDDSLTANAAQLELAQQQIVLIRRRAESDRARMNAALAGIGQQGSDIDAQIAIQHEAIASAADVLTRGEASAHSGFITRNEIERRRQAHVVARQELARLRLQRNALTAEAGRVGAELTRALAEAEAEVGRTQTSTQTLNQQQAQLRGERAYTLSAPISGRVSAMQTALGRTADPAVPLMEIVPHGSALRIEVFAPTRAVGFIRPGQEVRLLYDAFPYQRFGSFGGRVSAVSNSVIDPRQLATPLRIEEPVYRIDVVPDAQFVTAFGERRRLQPGMTVTVNMVLDRRSFLDWLLQPLHAVTHRNGNG